MFSPAVLKKNKGIVSVFFSLLSPKMSIYFACSTPTVYDDSFVTLRVFWSWYEDVHVVWKIILRLFFGMFITSLTKIRIRQRSGIDTIKHNT